jgi:hypothetical protein
MVGSGDLMADPLSDSSRDLQVLLDAFYKKLGITPNPEAALDNLQLALDILGLVPGIGEAADAASGAISLGRGDYVGAALSGASLVPIGGQIPGAGKIARGLKRIFGAADNVPTSGLDEAASAFPNGGGISLDPGPGGKISNGGGSPDAVGSGGLTSRMDDILPRGDVPLDESFEALNEARAAGARIEWGTPTARNRLYENNRVSPKDPNSFERSTRAGNSLFGLDETGRPTVFLRKDATRIELLEELRHLDQFKQWAKGRPKGESAEQLIDAWRAHISDPKVRARMEIEAAREVLNWLQKNGGTAQEIEAIKLRLAHWEDFFLGLGGRL